jgi:hypothetical protein
MSVFSWMSSCGTVRDDRPTLVQIHDVDPDDPMRQAAAEDLALIESDNQPSGEADPDQR